jgi:hypothetical protein
LREDTESPDFWRNDLETTLPQSAKALTHDDFDIPFDLKGQRSDEENRTLMRELFIRYGQLLRLGPKHCIDLPGRFMRPDSNRHLHWLL